jgi:hypothetical protein
LLARVELAASAFLLAWFAMYLHTTGVESSRCGLRILSDLPLRGDDRDSTWAAAEVVC